jgi:hypothetical protein
MECETEDRLNQLREAEQAVRERYGRAAPAMMAGLPLNFEERLAALQRMAGVGGNDLVRTRYADRSRTNTREE